MFKALSLAAVFVAMAAPAVAQTAADAKAVVSVVRTPILGAQLSEPKTIDHVRGVSVTFTPGQRTGRHEHPIPVVGYVVRGTITFQVDGQPARTLHAGDAFFEPANTAIAVFDNLSASEPASFIGFYLMGSGETEVVRAVQ
jgi:quercetin dioxygenase-like cupin family protein